MSIKTLLTGGLKTGLALAATTTAAIMLASQREQGDPWTAVNAIAHVVDGDETAQPAGWSLRASLLGLAINGAAMASWGVLYEGALQGTRARSSLLTGAAGTAVSYVIDYHVVPKRLTPGIEDRLSPRAVFGIYAVLGVTLALSGLWNRTADRE